MTDNNLKQYWMPDSTGRECYQCEERFTTFRRRHHCRLCEQISCAKCCCTHIDGASLGYMGELRLCNYCARKVQRLADDGKTTPTRAQTPVNGGRKVSFERSSAHKNSDTVRTVSNGAIWSLCPPESSIEATPSPQLGSRRSSLVPNSSGPDIPTILSVADLCATNSAMLSSNHQHPMITEEDESGPDWFRTMHPGMDSVINNGTSDSADVFAYANLAGAITNGFTDMMDARTPVTPSSVSDQKITFPSLSLDESVMNAAKEEQRAELDELFRRNTERILDEVLKREYIREDIWRGHFQNLEALRKVDFNDLSLTNSADCSSQKSIQVSRITTTATLYWMPDSTGRECYQCEERFTTFRRRHHCRLCGQIFCAKCCSTHIDGASLGYMGDLRLCDYCARKVQRLAEDGKTTPTRAQTPVNGCRKVSFERNSADKNSDTVKTVSNGAIWSLCPPESFIEATQPPQLSSRRSSLVPISSGPGIPTILSVADLCATNSAMLSSNHQHPMITDKEESGPDWFCIMHPGMDGVINNEISDSADVFAHPICPVPLPMGLPI